MAPTSTTGPAGPDALLALFADPATPLRPRGVAAASLEDIARRIAAEDCGGRAVGGGLLKRTRDNHRLLVEAHRSLSKAAAAGEAASLDAEWLLDNFHVIDDVFGEVLTDLPRGYYEQLPAQRSGPYAGLPCTFALAVGLLAHADSSLNEPSLRRYVQAFQETRPLTLGE
ncbi:MAG: hypothetical protein ACRC33_23360, partial [Gemmataceae bacterium]